MKVCDFNKLKKEKTPQQIIYMYINEKINLTSKQIDDLIEAKKEEKILREHTQEKRKLKLKIRFNTLLMRLKGELND